MIVNSSERIAVERNNDGRLEIFAVSSEGSVYHKWQKAPNSPWKRWSLLGKPNDRARRLVAAKNKCGRLAVFGIGTNECVHYSFQTKLNGPWSDWQRLGTEDNRVKDIAVGRNDDGRLEVFGIGTDQRIYHAYQNEADKDEWSCWDLLPGSPMATCITVALDDGSRCLYAFAVDKDDGIVKYTSQTSPSNGWPDGLWSYVGLGKLAATSIEVGCNKDGSLEAFAIDPDGSVWRCPRQHPTGPWEDWVSFPPSPTATSIAVDSNEDKRLEVFITDTDGIVHHYWQDPGDCDWHNWQFLDDDDKSPKTIGVAVERNKTEDHWFWTEKGGLEVFVTCVDTGVVCHKWQKKANSPWDKWKAFDMDVDT